MLRFRAVRTRCRCLFLLATLASPRERHPSRPVRIRACCSTTSCARHGRRTAKLPVGPVVGAIRLCDEARTTRRARPRALSGRRVGEGAAGVPRRVGGDRRARTHAATAIKYFTALIDDLDDDRRRPRRRRSRAARSRLRDPQPRRRTPRSRTTGSHKLMPRGAEGARAPALEGVARLVQATRAIARASPGSNYHAGYLLAATMIAIAQAGEAGADGTALWQLRRRRDVGQGHGARALDRRRARRRRLARGLAVRPALGRRVRARRTPDEAAPASRSPASSRGCRRCCATTSTRCRRATASTPAATPRTRRANLAAARAHARRDRAR